ncbi:MAG TPA: hypothetical protein V6C57_01920 [Coleofasciculaceae cyanobacterium]
MFRQLCPIIYRNASGEWVEICDRIGDVSATNFVQLVAIALC